VYPSPGGPDAGKHGAIDTAQYYLPAASAYREWAADKGRIGVDIVNWRKALEQKWTALRFGEVKLETDGGQHVFEAHVSR
jgi:starch phosphorylase